MSRLLDAILFSLLVLPGGPSIVEASGVLPGSQEGNSPLPFAATLAGCPTSCGNLTFSYPFGIGSRCFRNPEFSLICNNTMQSATLFLGNGTIQLLDSIDNPYSDYSNNYIVISISHTIPLQSGVDDYNMSWKTPGKSFTLVDRRLNITGCNLDVYFGDQNMNTAVLFCTITCPEEGITDFMARQNCNGTGCCSIWGENPINAFHLRFVHHNKDNLEPHSNRSSLWDRINMTTFAVLYWNIVDKPTCTKAMENRTSYACVSNNSHCIDAQLFVDYGYSCRCNAGYQGNPYILHGCSRDKGYDSIQQRANCTRWCGTVKVLFPFGLEDGCFARKEFYLNCTNTTSSTILLDNYYHVSEINVEEGLIKYSEPSEEEGSISYISEARLFGDSGGSISMQWVVANLTCLEAKQNKSEYACVSVNSICVPLNSTKYYIGYRCKCSLGFHGNPYIHNGCEDINECKEKNNCTEVCQNTIGSYHCSECPHKTEYDRSKMKCTPTKQQNLLLGIIIGLSGGFGILLLILSGIFFIRRWKRDIQKQLRRKYFRKNQGLLLEQLISSDVNASDKTKIFSLEEMEKATNNFDPIRLLGRGGHGMVYKGILSDQRVVAIKRSKVIEESEINQFINEVAILSQINHRNIVNLYGCCLETEVPLLVYDFIPNGSLFEILHDDSNDRSSLSWDDCIRIAVETAGALYYLHSAASVSIFHRDVKSSNILLDGNYTAKVSDFGASRLVSIDQTHVITNVQGTFGYLDPEYYHTGNLNEKSDVYSFGVVLVELLLRKRPIFTSESGLKQNLSNYFLWDMKVRPITEIVAAQILDEASEEEINSFASLAEMCLRLRGEERPTMKQVEMALQFLQTKRSNSSQDAPRIDEEKQTLLTTSAKTNSQFWAVNLGHKANLASQHSQKCYSLEQEFMSSAGLPR